MRISKMPFNFLVSKKKVILDLYVNKNNEIYINLYGLLFYSNKNHQIDNKHKFNGNDAMFSIYNISKRSPNI